MEGEKTITRINGITIEEIERRGIPIHDNLSDPQWRMRSFDGFLGENEKFEEVIEKDKETLSEIGISIDEIIQALREIIIEASNLLQHRNNVPISISFRQEKLKVTRNWFQSPQFSLFYNEEIPERGDHKIGVIKYIKWFGFFEGGHPKNQYRVDPYILSSVLFGISNPKTNVVWEERSHFILPD